MPRKKLTQDEIKQEVIFLQDMGHKRLALESGERETPDYINVDSANFTATFVRVPEFADVPYPVQMFPELVVEFYSR